MSATRRAVIVLLAATLTCSGTHAAEYWKPDGDTCNQASTTLAIVECLNGRTSLWDGRLNHAYKALSEMLKDPSTKGQAEQLKTAQRAWIKYRDANCAYYEFEQGTIRQIEVASCVHDMTQARAIELQAAGPH